MDRVFTRLVTKTKSGPRSTRPTWEPKIPWLVWLNISLFFGTQLRNLLIIWFLLTLTWWKNYNWFSLTLTWCISMHNFFNTEIPCSILTQIFFLSGLMLARLARSSNLKIIRLDSQWISWLMTRTISDSIHSYPLG